MDRKDAEYIQDMWQRGFKIDAIRRLRRETSMGLHQAKGYLENIRTEDLVKRLSGDFVKDPRDLLIEAIDEQKRLCSYIEQLVIAIKNEAP